MWFQLGMANPDPGSEITGQMSGDPCFDREKTVGFQPGFGWSGLTKLLTRDFLTRDRPPY